MTKIYDDEFVILTAINCKLMERTEIGTNYSGMSAIIL